MSHLLHHGDGVQRCHGSVVMECNIVLALRESKVFVYVEFELSSSLELTSCSLVWIWLESRLKYSQRLLFIAVLIFR